MRRSINVPVDTFSMHTRSLPLLMVFFENCTCPVRKSTGNSSTSRLESSRKTPAVASPGANLSRPHDRNCSFRSAARPVSKWIRELRPDHFRKTHSSADADTPVRGKEGRRRSSMHCVPYGPLTLRRATTWICSGPCVTPAFARSSSLTHSLPWYFSRIALVQ